MTEPYAIEDGRLRVARVEGKSNVDVDLADVTSYHYERGARKDTTGALVVFVGNRPEPVVVRVDSEDAADAIERMRAAMSERDESVNLDKQDEPDSAVNAAETEDIVVDDSADTMEAEGTSDGRTE